MSGKKDCILFLCHDTRPGAMAELARLTASCASNFDVIPLFDLTHGEDAAVQNIDGARVLTYASAAPLLGYEQKFAQHPGTFWPNNIDGPTLWFWKSHPDYERYWLVEYDVRYSGDWADFFAAFDDNPSDLLATGVFDYAFRPDWRHWDSFRAADDRPVPREDLVRATLSIFRLSNRAFAAIDDAYRRGASGHYEVAIPALVRLAGMTIEDIGGDGAFVEPENINRHYLNTPKNPGLAPGTFVLHEADRMATPIPNVLWNPFKD